ncbi:MAG TPA: phosphotriesterase [Ruminiclostridium sp.]
MTDSLNHLIQTVRYCIASPTLGYCQSHEHLFIADGQSAKLVPSLRIDDFSKTVSELNSYKDFGGVSIVDAQPIGCGRMAEELYSASVSSGINIIASTGFHKLIFYPEEHWIHAMDESELFYLFRNEIEHGMYINCDKSMPSQQIAAKAGIIKTASDLGGPTGEYLKLFSAAAKASKHTGIPILSHTEAGKGALEQVQIFADHGVPLDSIILCHIDRKLDDFDFQLAIAKTGVYMEFDTIGRFKYHSDEEEAAFIIKMVEQGYEDKILIGLDTTRERLKSYGGAIGLDYILTKFIPLLKSYGLSERIIEKFTIINPAKAFTIKPKI